MTCSLRSPTAASATRIFIKPVTNGAARFSPWCQAMKSSAPWRKSDPAVKKFKTSDRVGVGCFVDSCRTCAACREGSEQYCEAGMLLTYSGRDKDGQPTQGGYSTQIVVDEDYVLRIPSVLSPAGAAPLLCAGITTYSPLRHWGVGKYHKLAVVGLGGLGHMAVKIGKALGTEVTVLSTSERKRMMHRLRRRLRPFA